MIQLKVIEGGKSDGERFAALVAPHYKMLYRVALRWTRSEQDAEDLVQEVCVRAFPRLEELLTLEQPQSWMVRVMYRLFVDWTRRYERRHVVSLEGSEMAPESTEPGPDQAAETTAATERLGRAWAFLDKEQQALLAMHDLEGYSLREMTVMTGLKEGTLKSKLHRARARLGKLLQRENLPSAPQARIGT
jgi:RNA polymerase sigma factor (sigma-70 family)